MDIISGAQNQSSSVVRYVRNERMAGFIASYDPPKSLKDNENITFADGTALPGQQGEVLNDQGGDDGFSFFDFLDMINPLQHIPVVNLAYRALTGDEIKPVSKIIGGAVYGGALGAAGGIINAVIEEETGGDLVENAISFVSPSRKEQSALLREADAQKIAYDDLPVSLLKFAERPFART